MKLKIKIEVIENKLKPLLSDIVPFFVELDVSWKVTYFEGVAKINSNYSLLELEDQIKNSDGLEFTYSEIKNNFYGLDDLHEFEVSGFKKSTNETLFRIELQDSSFWEIETFGNISDLKILEELKKKYC